MGQTDKDARNFELLQQQQTEMIANVFYNMLN